MARRGFTLIEVMVALAIVSTVSAAALKLCSLAERSLSDVREERSLIREASSIKTGVLTGRLADSGTSGDIRWESAAGRSEIMGESFGQLSFDGTSAPRNIEVTWRELKVSIEGPGGEEHVIVFPIEGDGPIKFPGPPKAAPENGEKAKDKNKEGS